MRNEPIDTYLESSVLGGLLLGGLTQDASDVLATLAPEAFQIPFYRKTYEEIRRQAKQKSMIDAMLIAEVVARESGDYAILMETAKNTPSAANLRGYAKAVHEKFVIQSFAKLMESHYDAITMAPHHENALSAIELFTSEIQKIDRSGEEIQPVHISDLLDNYVTNLEERFAKGDESDTLKTGIETLDEITGGLNLTDMIIIAARPGMGKTELALKIASKVADGHVVMGEQQVRRGVLIFSMEMKEQQIVERQLANASNLSVSVLRKPQQMDDEGWGRIAMGMKELTNLDVWVVDATNLTIEQINVIATRHKRRYPGLSLIMADYLGLIKKPAAERNDLAVGEISRGLKTMAMTLLTPVVCLSQLSRKVEDRPNKRPQLADLRDSGSIEQDADGIWFIYRDSVYNQESPSAKAHIAEIIIGKNRHGPGGTAYQEFRNGHFMDTDQAHAEQISRERPPTGRHNSKRDF